MTPSRNSIEELLSFLGYSVIPEKEQLLDSDVLFQQKDMRERIVRSYKLFGQKAQWAHPVSKQTFDVEAMIMLFELVDEQSLRSKWPFEITRYVVRFGLRSAQGLFFFVAPNSRSFVVSAYTESLEVPERIQVRRLVVDVDNVARTDLESLAELFYSLLTPATIIERFRVALPYLKVGQAFFKEYHTLFQLMSKRLLKVFGSKAKAEAYGYAQRLLGRITFLYFLQRKGWLDKDRAYLKKRTRGLDGRGLFRFLYELFDILNTEGYEDKSKGIIPYLNGSLFEKEPYSQAQMKQLMDACTPCVGDVLNVFDQYNFTISESTPLDKEVAVDPELLGSLFESMLPEAERGDKGTFYTHQEEMLFMAQEALRVYLSRFPNLLTQDQVFYLVYGLELGEKQRIEPKVAREVKEVLRQIKILDPAVGSGGFLMAAIQTVLEIRKRLNGIIGAIEQDYDVKLEVIQNNLFGVDIEHEAIELARLRLWLTLVVDESLENVRPLPNLDYNLHRGDSLVIPELEKKLQTKLTVDATIRNALLRDIQTIREQYSRSHGKEKEMMRDELDKGMRKLLELETGYPSPEVIPFSFKFYFADVLALGGFDVILMNPPYVRQEQIGKILGQNPQKYKEKIVEDAQWLTGNKFIPNKRSDISVYFHIRSLSLLRPGGVAVVIASSKWLDVAYGAPLQEFLLRSAAIDTIYDSAGRSFAADVNTVITVIRSVSNGQLRNIVRFVFFKTSFGNVTGKMIKDIINSYAADKHGIVFNPHYRLTMRTQESLYQEGLIKSESSTESGYAGTKWGNLHLRAPAVYYEILAKAQDRLKRAREVYDIKSGIKTGANAFFIMKKISVEKNGLVRCQNGLGRDFLIENDFAPPIVQDPEEAISFMIKQKDLPFRVLRCLKDKAQLKETYVLKYIEWAEKSEDALIPVLRGQNKGKPTRIPKLKTVSSRSIWYQIPEVHPSNIILPLVVKNRHLIIGSEEPVYLANNFSAMYTENFMDTWLYLNSSIFRFFMEICGRTEGAGALQIPSEDYGICYVLDPMPPLSKEFSSLVNFKKRKAYRIINIAEQEPLEFEQPDRKELDNLVLESIGFTNKEERERILNEVYDWLRFIVRSRLSKPKTAPESVTKAIGKKRVQTDLREFQ